MVFNETPKEVKEILEKLNELTNRVELLEIIAKKGSGEESRPATKEIIQINMGDKKYFCETQLEHQAFKENNPTAKTESFNVEMPTDQADKYLNDPENKKQFVRKE